MKLPFWWVLMWAAIILSGWFIRYSDYSYPEYFKIIYLLAFFAAVMGQLYYAKKTGTLKAQNFRDLSWGMRLGVVLVILFAGFVLALFLLLIFIASSLGI